MKFSVQPGLLGLGLCVTLGACSSPSDVAELTPYRSAITDGQLLSSTAAISNTFILTHGQNYIICTPPAPDAAFDQAEKADITIFSPAFGGGSDGADSGESTTEVEMSARTPALLMSRELLFRACEFSRNYGLDRDGAEQIYLKTLDGIFKMWAIEARNTDVLISDQVIEAGVNASGSAIESEKPSTEKRKERGDDEEKSSREDNPFSGD